jgi:radical SAM superfamily enzyme YgiQ (UPF0313 family)
MRKRVLLFKSYFYETSVSAGIAPPIGLLYIASMLREHGYDVMVVDLKIKRRINSSLKHILTNEALYENAPESVVEFKAIEDALGLFKPDIVGISAMTIEAPAMHKIAKKVKELRPDIKIIVGGPHPTSFPEETLSDNNIDYIVRGEGEISSVSLINAILNKQPVNNVKGIAYKNNGKIVFTSDQPLINNLDMIPMPAYDLVEFDKYKDYRNFTHTGFFKYGILFTSRSCPYRCIYCHAMFGKGFRAHSKERVIKEIKLLNSQYGLTNFLFIDDIFNLNYNRTIDILDAIHNFNKRLDISFPNGLRLDRLDKTLIDKLKRAGTSYIACPIESANPRIQHLIKKELNIDKARQSIYHIVHSGIYTRGYFMLGFPTETIEEIKNTVNFAINTPLHAAWFFIVTPFEGTELYEMVKDNIDKMKIPSNKLDYFYGTYNLSAAETDELLSTFKDAYISFYVKNPLRVLRSFMAHPHKPYFVKYQLISLLPYIYRARKQRNNS